MRRLAMACVVLAACSHIFGLDSVPADDRDGDHWPDGDDNCPDVYNPDQSDVDGNHIGDRCQVCMSPTGLDDDGDGIPNECDGCDNRQPDNNHDGVPDACEHLNDAGMIVIPLPDAGCTCAPCALGPAHDEDGDQVADACDDCPIFASAFETGDSDGDGVGDQCDVSTSPSHQLFDAFAVRNQDWFETGMWTVSGDALHVVLLPFQTSYRQLGTGASHFAIRTRILDLGNPSGDADVGLIATRGANITSATFDEQLECRVRTAFGNASGSMLVFQQRLATNPTLPIEMPIATAGPFRVQLEYDAKASAVSCFATTTAGTIVSIKIQETDPSRASWSTGLVALPGGGTGELAYYELVTDD